MRDNKGRFKKGYKPDAQQLTRLSVNWEVLRGGSSS